MPTTVNNSKAKVSLSSSKSTPKLPDPQWTSILDSFLEGICVHSAADEIVWANRALCELYGKSLSDLKGLSCRQAFHADESCPHKQVLATDVRLTEELRLSGRILSATIGPVFDDDGNTCGFMRVMRDVTSERHAQEQSRNAERFATLGQLLFGVAHDVGTPLNVISGYAEFLLMRTKSDGQGFKELSAILEQTRHIAVVFGQALDMARPQQGRTDAIEIVALLTDSLNLIGHHLRRAGIKASLTCRITPPLIYGETPQLRQAFFNLLLNAGQQIGAGGMLQLVVDEAQQMPGFLSIELHGREADGAEHDFSQSLAFLFTKNESEPTGIGLSLAKRILDEMGARIVPAEDGAQGVAVTIHLPMNPAGRA